MGNSPSKQSSVEPRSRTVKQPVVPPPSEVKKSNQVIQGRAFHDISSTYFLPMDDEENDRLHEEHFLIKAGLGGNLLDEGLLSSKLQDGATVLDIGCGPGTWLLDLATEYPSSTFHGMDIAPTFPTMIKPPNVTFKIGDALDNLPYRSDTFDLVQIRLMVAAFRFDEWDTVYKNVMRVLKPGGYIQVMEPDIRLFAEHNDVAIQDYSVKVTRFLQKRGQDPDLIHKLGPLLKRNGYTIIMENINESPLGWGSRLYEIIGNDYIRGMKAAAPIVANEFEMSMQQYEHTLDNISTRFVRAKTYIHSFLGLAQKPGTDDD
ncbi:hypothetical protein INT44_000309 [Umbelopsis vinacea]|uniref:Methyltransferase domain-containing protein n=1 Tax=Umbelopsis vinacea TaxID=44442 RepID=A0A8H7PMB1_9FUNG|nr:hypothetical protein INT44_000309 [Umbelopsis vinacea]